MSSPETNPGRNCNICGRLMRAVMAFDDERGVDRFVRWQCVKVGSDGEGGWDHD